MFNLLSNVYGFEKTLFGGGYCFDKESLPYLKLHLNHAINHLLHVMFSSAIMTTMHIE